MFVTTVPITKLFGSYFVSPRTNKRHHHQSQWGPLPNLMQCAMREVRQCHTVCWVFVCKYVLGHSRVSQPLNLRLSLLRHLGFLTSPYASPTCRRRRLTSYRLLRRSTPNPPPILLAYLLHLPASPRPPLYTSLIRMNLDFFL